MSSDVYTKEADVFDVIHIEKVSATGRGGAGMSEKRLNNIIFLMYLVTENYCKAYHITARQFLDLDKKYEILNYVSECPDIFDSMTEVEMVEEVDRYVS